MNDINNNISYTNMRDLNNIDNSINITNNYNIRINLENRALDNKTYEYTLFCLHEYKNNKIKEKDIMRITCINIHSESMFISDHMHLAFPKRLYDDTIYNYSLMKVKAKAYKYQRKNGTYDYGLLVTKVESAVNRLGHYEGKYGNKNLFSLNKDQEEYFEYIYKKSTGHQYLCEMLVQQISFLEGIIAHDNYIYSGFLFNMLATYYFANDYKEELETRSLYLCNLDKNAIIDLLQLFSKIIFKINNGEIFMWRQFLQETNEICNVLQGITKNINKVESKEISVRDFANKIETKETRKIFNKIRLRNEDYGYQYPKNVNKFNKQLDDFVIWYMINQQHYSLDSYSESWRDDLGII